MSDNNELRDMFAAHALQGLAAGQVDHDAHLVAEAAYDLADAMLVERAKSAPGGGPNRDEHPNE